MNKRDELLCEILDCGIDDLRMLDDVLYPWHYILMLYDEGADLDFNTVMRFVVEMGKDCIGDAVSDRLHELEQKPSLSEEEAVEKAIVSALRPDADFKSYHNNLDTNVWCERNGRVYKRYFQYALDQFEQNTGLPINING